MRDLWLLVALVGAVACGGAPGSEASDGMAEGEPAGTPSEEPEGGPGAAGGPGGGRGPGGGEAGASGSPSAPGATSPDAPGASPEGTSDPAVLPPATAVEQPLRRLSHREYQNTLRDLLPGVALSVPPLATEEVIDGFSNHWDAMQPSELLTEQYRAVALSVARALDAAAAAELAGCPDTSCADGFVRGFGQRAFRRPLSEAELGSFVALFEQGAAASDFTLGVQLVVMSFLQSPYFLYRAEFGSGDAADARGKPLDPYETATRLSYLLWATMPDDALFARAADGSLADAAVIESEVRRMLDDPKAADGIEPFFREWLELDRLERVLKLPEAGWDEAYRAELVDSAVRFAYREVFGKGGSVSDLLLSTRYPVTAATAPLFGATAGDGWTVIDADPGERSGILTHPAFLGAHGYGEYGSPVLRGVYVMNRMLCSPPQPPPGNVNIDLPEAPSEASEPRTNREAYEQATSGAECQVCHTLINGFGFAFEHYDTLGQYRARDSGFPVDASGSVGEFQFDGAVELSEQLAASDAYRDCVVEKWATYAFGGSPLAEEPRLLAELRASLEANDGSLRELLVALAVHERYSRYLAGPEGTP